MKTATLVSAIAAAALAAGTASVPFTDATPGYDWRFPADHGSHPGYAVEWWYFTGHLEAAGDSRRRYGYQFTLFRVGLTPEKPGVDSAWSAANLLMGHASLTDKEGRTHRFSEVLYRETPFLAGFVDAGSLAETESPARIAWSRGPVGTDRQWTLDFNGTAFDFAMADRGNGFAFELETRPAKPLVFQGPGGYSRKTDGPGAGSQYYSFTRLTTRGTLTLDGQVFDVHGESWMDHEFSSSQLTEAQVGWDWFALQLDDGREVMLYSLRRADGSRDFARGTLIDRDGTPTYLGPDAWSATPRGRWTSALSGAGYPAGWTIALPGAGLKLIATPDVADQENRATRAGRLSYWEGAVTLTDPAGKGAGQGYVELTGYGEDNRPPI